MVGDEDQLPSVGAGNVLGGVIASGVVPTIRLRDIFRQAAESMIVSNAHRIVTGQLPGKGSRDSDFFMLESAACLRAMDSTRSKTFRCCVRLKLARWARLR